MGAGPGGSRRREGEAGLENKMVRGCTWEEKVGLCRRMSSRRKRSVRKSRDSGDGGGGGGAQTGSSTRFHPCL